MGQVADFVGIGVEVVTGEPVAASAKFHALLTGAFIGRTAMRFAKGMLLQGYSAVVIAAPAAKRDFLRDAVFLGQFLHHVHCLLILMGQEEVTVEAVQTAGGGHLKIIHYDISFRIARSRYKAPWLDRWCALARAKSGLIS